MLKKTILIFTAIICFHSGFTQNSCNYQIQEKIIEGYDYIEKYAEQNPKDLVIITIYNNGKFFFVNSYGNELIEAKEIIPPDIKNIQTDVIIIDKDSVADVFWIKKKKYQNLLLNEYSFPFEKITSRWQASETFEKIQQEIISKKHEILTREKNAIKDKYYLKLKEKYPDLEKLETKNTQMTFFELSDDEEIIAFQLKYPQEALLNGTQGTVEVAYVLTKNYDVEHLKVYNHLKDGCTESVINLIMDISKRFKEKGYKNEKNLFIEANIDFILM